VILEKYEPFSIYHHLAMGRGKESLPKSRGGKGLKSQKWKGSGGSRWICAKKKLSRRVVGVKGFLEGKEGCNSRNHEEKDLPRFICRKKLEQTGLMGAT